MVGVDTMERHAEIEVLGGLISRAAAGRGGLVAVEGPAGIGRTRLLAHARHEADSAGWRVFDTRCTPLSHTINACVLRDWFGLLAHRSGDDERTFDGPGRALRDLAAGHEPSIGDLAYAVRWVLEDLTRDQPVLLVVDDLQWADPASVESLDLLSSALEQLPCLMLYAVRGGEPAAAPEPLARLQSTSAVLTPRPWSLPTVGEVVRSVRPDASDAEVSEIHRRTGGIPFLVTELVAADGGIGSGIGSGIDSGHVPESVVASVSGRLSRLSATATETVRAVCVLGSTAGVDTVAALTGLQLPQVADDISALVAAQVLLSHGGQLVAAQPLICDALLVPMTAHDASELHRRAAQLLSTRGGTHSEVVDHLVETLPEGDSEVRDQLRERGELALDSGDMERAGRYLQRALAEGPLDGHDVDLMSAAARALAGQRRLDEAVAVWERATELAPDEPTRERLRAEAGDALLVAGRHHDAQATINGPGGLAGLADANGEQHLVPRMVLAGLLNGVSLDHLRPQVDAVLQYPPAGDSDDERQSLTAASVVLSFDGRSGQQARDLALRAIGHGAILRDPGSEGASLFFAAGVLNWTSAFSECEALLTSAIQEAEERGSATALGTAAACRGAVRVRMGLISQAVSDLELALAQRRRGWNAFLAPVLSALVECRIARGELDGPVEHRDELEELTHAPGLTGAYAVYALADLAAAQAEHERAADLYAEVGRLVAGRMDNPAILPWRAGEALSRIRIGAPRDAVILARDNVDRARAFGSPYALAQGLRAMAAVDATGDRVAMLRDALEALHQTQAPRLEAQIATDLAGMLLLTQGMDATQEPVQLLRRAESYAAFQELRPLAGRVQRILERIGEPVKRSATETLTSLTASERRVADLAASGLSNRQIAGELFVTVKAVEWHLSNVYRKLGIRSRTRLPGLLSGVPKPRSAPGGSPAAGQATGRTMVRPT